MKNVTIARIMTPAPATVTPTATVAEANRVMRERNCHHVPVVEAGRIVGMLAGIDVMKALALSARRSEAGSERQHDAAPQRPRVADVMQSNVEVLGQTATLLDAARALRTGAYHALPVVAPGGHLVGIVTSTDVIQALADEIERAERSTLDAAPSSPSADAATDPQLHALRDVYRAVRNYLSSGRAETEHTRLVQAAERARDALHAAHVVLPR